ncbi:MAG: SsrA-binding protein SmpB [Verrucomicrobia bacterium]|nr:SsrA-binding protein SmpB [Verrucomicrobiota bacterium]
MSAIATNRKARRDYAILETVEAGVALTGTEVKSLRAGRASINEAFARIERDEVWLFNAHIPEYTHGNIWNHPPTRQRKLLLHRDQIDRLKGRLITKGLALVPLQLYFNKRGIAKVELALAHGKTVGDRREDIKRKTAEREMAQAMSRALKGKRQV